MKKTVQNYDLKTVTKVIGTTVATLGLGVVPTSMKRYFTFISAGNEAGQQNVIYLCSAANSANVSTVALASAAQKFSIRLEVAGGLTIPVVPSPDKPLFSIAAGAYVNARTSKGNCRVFLQYYDQ
jgi:hypothetical protein